MIKNILFISSALLFCQCSTSSPSVPLAQYQVIDEDYDDAQYQAWSGPGWYYGVYFDDEETYFDWMESQFYSSTWEGPNWYYGIWFSNENDFNAYRNNHKYYGMRRGQYPQHHGQEQRGAWKGSAPPHGGKGSHSK